MGFWRKRKQKVNPKSVSRSEAPVNTKVDRKISKSGRKLTKIDHAFWQKFERDLIAADLPASLVIDIILKARKRFSITSPEPEVRQYIKTVLIKYYDKVTNSIPVRLISNRLNVHLIIGVNGVGKTTTIAKLAFFYQQQNCRILMIAADTFRAGAIVQLKTWATRLKIDCFSGAPKQTPASVVFQGLMQAQSKNYDLVLIDTAGRLHTKTPLMQEIAKINQVIVKQINRPADAVLLVMDAQVGSNAMVQAQQFTSTLKIDGIILTKTDSTAKGGAAIALGHQLNLPIRWIGTGETVDSLKPFQIDAYVANLVRSVNYDQPAS